MKILFTSCFYVIVFGLFGQCDFPINCEGVDDLFTISPTTAIDVYNPEQITFCIDPSSNLSVMDSMWTQGRAYISYVRLDVMDSTQFVFISAINNLNGKHSRLNLYTFQDCDSLELYRSYKNDITEVILDVEVTAGQQYLLEIITPDFNITEQSDISLSVTALSDLQICEPHDMSGNNQDMIIEVTSRSIGNFDDPLFYPGEKVEVKIDYVFAQPVQNFPTWLHYVSFMTSGGWSVSPADTRVEVKQSFNEILEGELSSTDSCGVVSRVALPYFCTYLNVLGNLEFCNMLTQDCPCSESPVSPGDYLPVGWTFTRTAANCPNTCSPSDKWGVGFISSDLDIYMDLTIDSVGVSTSDLQVAVMIATDAITGCFEPNNDYCVPHMVSWSPKWQVVDESETYGIVNINNDSSPDICLKDSVEVEVIVNNIDNKEIYIRQYNQEGLSPAELDIQIFQDTVIKVFRENTSNTILNINLDLISIENDVEKVLDSVQISYLPELTIVNDDVLLCIGECKEVEFKLNIDRAFNGVWHDGGVFGTTRIFCTTDESPLIFQAWTDGDCFSENIEIAVTELDDIEIVIDKPSYLCNNDLQIPESERKAIVIDTIIGGSGAYDYSWFSFSSWVMETEIGGKPALSIDESQIDPLLTTLAVQFEVVDDNDCNEFVFINVDILKDSLVQLEPACRDGFFDLDNPQNIITLSSIYDKEIIEVEWIPRNGLIGHVVNDTTFVVNEEASPLQNNNWVLSANIQFADGCDFTVNYTLVLFTSERSFDFEVTDFEVDFIPTDLAGFTAVFWDFGDGSTSTEVFPTHIYEEKGFYDVTLIVSDQCTTITKIQTVPVGPVSTTTISDFDISIYPIPASRILTVESEKHFDNVIIYSVGGQVVKQCYSQNRDKLDLDVSFFDKGLYVVKIIGDNFVYSQLVSVFSLD